MNYRLYSFVANHYISPLQAGLQTAHVVSELSQFKLNTRQRAIFDEWAQKDKTIIICGAGNHQGVVDCFAEIKRTGGDALCLPAAIFHEDEQSMNGMATACGVIVPQDYWDAFYEPEKIYETQSMTSGDKVVPAQWVHLTTLGERVEYSMNYPEGQFINHIKQYRLA